MKIMFIHISDIHCKESDDLSMKINKIVDTTNLYDEIEKIIIICTGDLTNSGSKNEYNVVRKNLGNLLFKLGKKFDQKIELFVVPGNHDLYYPQKDFPNNKVINEQLKSDNPDEYLKDYCDRLNNFYNYSVSKNCFKKDKIVDTIIFTIKDIKLQFNLINTAPFSLSGYDNKESHYLPEEKIYKLIKEDNCDYCMTLMHHGTEWFCYQTKQYLENVLFTNSEIIFQGHEHIPGLSYQEDENGNKVLISKCGQISGKSCSDSSYSIIVMDTENNNLTENIFLWDKESRIFKHSKKQIFDLEKKDYGFLKPKKEFIKELIKDNEQISDSVLDYFTFPTLEGNDENKFIRVDEQESFFELLKSKKFINIRGKSLSGKSVILKDLYCKSIDKGYFPVILNENNIQSKVSTITRNLFLEQYSNKETDFNKFEYTDKSKKIIFIDDFDKISENLRKHLIEKLLEDFGIIIVTSNNNVSLNLESNTQEKLLYELNRDIEEFPLVIGDFYKEKRCQLISNILKLNEEIDDVRVDNLIATVDYLVSKKYDLFELKPYFIIQYVKFFTSNSDYKNSKKTDMVFNVVFETNLKNQIINNSKGLDIDNVFTLLEEIAYEMHFNIMSDKISLDKIIDVSKICAEREVFIDVEKFISTMKNACILKETNENFKYEFVNINYLAYFVARKVSKLVEKESFNIPEIHTILNYICHSINDNILLFLLFLRNNTNFTINLCSIVQKYLQDIPEIDFDNSNVSFISNINLDNLSIPDVSDKQKYSQRKTQNERMVRDIQNEELSMQKLYDYPKDIDETTHNIPKAIKYLEIICKSFLSLFNDFDANEKEFLSSTILSSPNKILYYYLKRYDDEYDELLKALLKFVEENDASDAITENEIRHLIATVGNDICLNLYNSFAFVLSSKKISDYLKKQNIDTVCKKIFILMVNENIGDTNAFFEESIKLFNASNNIHTKYLIKRIVSKHILLKNKIDHELIDRINDKLFNKDTKKQLLIMNNKNNQKNE